MREYVIYLIYKSWNIYNIAQYVFIIKSYPREAYILKNKAFKKREGSLISNVGLCKNVNLYSCWAISFLN